VLVGCKKGEEAGEGARDEGRGRIFHAFSDSLNWEEHNASGEEIVILVL
jgi:hypothetical protein